MPKKPKLEQLIEYIRYLEYKRDFYLMWLVLIVPVMYTLGVIFVSFLVYDDYLTYEPVFKYILISLFIVSFINYFLYLKEEKDWLKQRKKMKIKEVLTHEKDKPSIHVYLS